MAEEECGGDEHGGEDAVEEKDRDIAGAEVGGPAEVGDRGHEECGHGRDQGGVGQAGGLEAGAGDADEADQEHDEVEDVGGVFIADDLNGGGEPKDEEPGEDREGGAELVGEIGKGARCQQPVEQGHDGKNDIGEEKVVPLPVPALDDAISHQRDQQQGQRPERNDEPVFLFHRRS